MKRNFSTHAGRQALSSRFNGPDMSEAMQRALLQKNFNKSSFVGMNDDDQAIDSLVSRGTLQYVITNVSSAAIKVALHPGYFDTVKQINTARGLNLDAIITEGDIYNTASTPAKVATGKGDPYPIFEFIKFSQFNPQLFTHLKIRVNNSSQLANNIEVLKLSPYRGLATDRINPSMYKTSSQTDDKLADIPLTAFQMDDQTLIYTTIEAGERVVFNWTAVTQVNAAQELAQWGQALAARLSAEYAK
ncbi:MAG: hypothetical protein LBD91_08430 [Prevotellaceae bacterium]|jgi:hypothetical protein|nr:hypothetical protein [Prevotellaceae bacterium]